MMPERNARRLLGITRSQAKMYEYSVPQESHIDITAYDPTKLYSLTLGLIGDLSYYVIEENQEKIESTKKNLHFSAHFFDALLQSKLNDENSDYLKLLGAASYYLCDLPGSANVLLESLSGDTLDLESNNIDLAIYYVLKNKTIDLNDESFYTSKLNEIFRAYQEFLISGNITNLFELLQSLRTEVYSIGSDRELLLIDVLYAILKIKYRNSSWIALPKYSGLALELWHDVIVKEDFIKELWPAQHLLGEQGVYKGKSAVIQMPTSAGKTKSTELIIRSSFLSERSKIAVIIAPFRALCNEIKNELAFAFHSERIEVNEFSDVLQVDETDELIEILESTNETANIVLVSTPEKFYFMIKQFPELADKIGLLIYDEGHQFDTGARGVTYELLLASLKTIVLGDIQTILISAVIGNADEINSWLNPNDGVVVEGTALLPTYRTVAFTSWIHTLGQVRFVEPENPDIEEYFVPKVIESYSLDLVGRERKARTFPRRNDSNTIALYLGLKLSPQGSVAIFSGRKSSIITMCNEITDAYHRNLDIPKPVSYADDEEINKLATLYGRHFGEDNTQVQTVKLGILTHHGNLPQGIKLSVEYALQKTLAKFVICTSTLAQGVNLPIKYLIVTSVYQGQEKLKVRDFRNLIGRAGRAGKYTEGSIIFANNSLYDNKVSEKWKWDGTKELLNPSNSEESDSSILTIFNPIYNKQGKAQTPELSVEQLLTLLNNPELEDIEDQNIRQQVVWKKTILDAIESYILANLDTDLHLIIENTLAYHSADITQKEKLLQLFASIHDNIINKVPEPERAIYAKSLFGIDDIKFYEDWLREHYTTLLALEAEELLYYLWESISLKINNNTFTKFIPSEQLINIATHWILGSSYKEILENTNNVKIGSRNLTIEHVIDLCEQAISFDATMIISTLIELMDLFENSIEKENLKIKLKFLQKQLKYGLNTINQILIYELGFNDRIIAQELSQKICGNEDCNFGKIKKQISTNQDAVEDVLHKYPTYFMEIYRAID